MSSSDTITDGSPIAADLHLKFVHALDENVRWKTQHLKLNGVYWGLSALTLLDRLDYNRDDVVDYVVSCLNEDGGFGGNTGLDSHLLYTMSAVQLLCLFDALDRIDVANTAGWVASMQLADGSFQGDRWGEVDTRFAYIACSSLNLLKRLDSIDLDKAVDWVLSCHNWDGGFGVAPGAESHAGQVFCCVGVLCIANAVDRIDVDQLAAWLAMRQLPSGGLNGRPEKKADVCYSWWVVSSLVMLRREHWIDKESLFRFILACEDREDGGISDKPGNVADVYHTFFGLCGLSLLGHSGHPLRQINPVYALPYDTLERCGVTQERGLLVGFREPAGV